MTEELSLESLKADLDKLRSEIVELNNSLANNAIQDSERREIIQKLTADRDEKRKELSVLSRLFIVMALGILSLSVRYNLEFTRSDGWLIRPSENAGLIIPGLYAASIVAVLTGNDKEIGKLLGNFGGK